MIRVLALCAILLPPLVEYLLAPCFNAALDMRLGAMLAVPILLGGSMVQIAVRDAPVGETIRGIYVALFMRMVSIVLVGAVLALLFPEHLVIALVSMVVAVAVGTWIAAVTVFQPVPIRGGGNA